MPSITLICIVLIFLVKRHSPEHIDITQKCLKLDVQNCAQNLLDESTRTVITSKPSKLQFQGGKFAKHECAIISFIWP